MTKTYTIKLTLAELREVRELVHDGLGGKTRPADDPRLTAYQKLMRTGPYA